MNGQSECGHMILKGSYIDKTISQLTAEGQVCGSCGCEENKQHEPLVNPCTCNGGLGATYPACIDTLPTTSTTKFCKKQADNSCKVYSGNDTVVKVGHLSDTQGKTGASDNGRSILVDPSLSSRKKVTDVNPNGRSVKRIRSGIPSGGEPAGEKQLPLKSVKEESAVQVVQITQKNDMPVSESEKGQLGVGVLTRRFSDAVVSVPIKKRKFNLICEPSPPRSPSPEHAELRTLTEVSTLEKLHDQLNGDGQQRHSENVDIAEASQQDLGGTYKSESRSVQRSIVEFPSSLVSWSGTSVNNADFSGISMLAAAACTDDHGHVADDKDVVAKTRSPTSDGVKSDLLFQDDMEIDSTERQREGDVVMDSEIQGIERNGELPIKPEAVQALALEDDPVKKQEKHFCPGESEQNHIYMGPPTELGLGINHSEGPGILNIRNDTNTIGLGLVKEKEEHKGLRLSSTYSRDDRSHWDLNTMMDKWESPTNEHSANPEQVSSLKILVETANNIGISDDVQIHTAVSESKSYRGCSEQYMLCKGLDEKKNEQELKESIPPLKFDNCTGSTISLVLNLDTSAQSNHIDELSICESSTSSSGPADGSGSINSLNLSVAPSKQFFNSAKNVCEEYDCSIQHKTCTANEVLEMHAEGKTANCQDIVIPEAGTLNKAEEGIDHLKDPSEIVIQEINSGHKTEISSPKCLLEHSKDHPDVSNGIKEQKGDTGPESGHGIIDNETHVLLSTVVEENFPVETATTKSDRGDTFAAVDQSLCKVDDTMVTVVKITSQNDGTMPLVDTVCKADTTISLVDSTCKVDEPGMENRNVCKVDSLLSFGESVSQVEVPVVADLNACNVDAPILNAETVRKFDPTAVNETVRKFGISITVNESISIGSDAMAVDGSVLKVESLEATDEKWGKIGSPVAMNESFYNVEDSEADDQNANMACSSVSIGESVCKLDVSEAVVDKSTTNDRSKNLEDIVEDPSGEMATEVACDCDYDYDVLDEEEEPLLNTEKVDKERMNDESQYEDGEYRETNSGDWVEDMAEDLEVEHVDYGYFDCRDADELGTYDEFSMPFQAESEHRGEDQVDIESIDEHERNLDYSQQDLTEDTMANTHKQGCNQAHPTAPESNASEHRDPKHETKLVKLLGQNNQITESKTHLDQHEDVELRDARHPSLSRQKSSGWDQLPEGFINAEEAMKSAKDSTEKRVQGAVWAVPNGRDSLGRIGSMSGRPLERARPGDLVHGRERVYIQEIRDGSFDSSPRFFSRATGRGRNSGRGGSLNGVQGRGRGDPWMDSPTGQWGTRGHHSPGYYGSPVRFGNLGHSNAAVVAAAKFESSGFVVAPDGTLVKLDGAGPTTRGMRPLRGVGRSGRGTVMGRGSSADEGNMPYRMPMGMGPGRRANMSPDRVMKVGRSRGGFGSDAVGLPRRGGLERYGGRLIGNSSSLDSLRRSMQSVDFRMTRRDRSFSPSLRRRSPPLRRGSPPNASCSRTKSYSRSRTRSPHMRSSPRGRVFSGMETGSGYSRHSRSPTIRPETRSERLRSPPSHRVGISGHTTSLIPSSRSQCSPSQASRWSSYNRDPEHERSHDYKRHFASTRNLPGRISPQSDRKSGFMDSPVRQKHNEYSRHIHSGRLDKPNNYVRRSRHEDHEKWKNFRHETLHSGRSVDVSNNDRRMLDEEEDGPRIHSSCFKEASELQGRGSPIVDEKEREKKAGSTSRRLNRKEDRSHLKYNRDGRPRGNIRSLGTHEIDDDVAPRRRRPS